MRNYKLDGFIERATGRNKAIEVMGCYIHGCLKCYGPWERVIGDRTAQEVNGETQQRLAKLRETLDVEEVWGCDIERELKEAGNIEMREFFEDMGREKGPIDPRMVMREEERGRQNYRVR